MITAADSVFIEREPGVFTRKCTANEAACSIFSENNGTSHATFSSNVKLLKHVDHDMFKEKVKKAMIRLRHLVPGLACTNSPLVPGKIFQFTYEVPTSLDSVRQWAADVVFVYDEPLSFEEAHDKINETVWWKASDGRYTHELHIHPNSGSSDSWTFSWSAHHSNIDGRSSYMCLEKVLAFLQDDLLERAQPLEDLVWGEETRRLSSSAESICSIAEKGVPDEFPDVSSFTMPAVPEDYVPFVPPYKADESMEDGVSSARLAFTKEQTVKLHSLCKEHGKTVTQAVMALANLANIEWALRLSSEKDDTYQAALDVFEKATQFPTSANAINMRGKLPASYRTFDTERSTPLDCVEGCPLSFPMEPYRKMLTVDRTDRTVTHAGDESIFWDELVKDIADAWENLDMSYGAYRFRAALASAMAMAPDILSSLLMNPSPVYTSTGDMSRCNIFESFRPSAGNEVLIVTDLHCTDRFLTPAITSGFLEYDGVFSFVSYTSRKFWTKSDIDLYMEIVRGWADRMF